MSTITFDIGNLFINLSYTYANELSTINNCTCDNDHYRILRLDSIIDLLEIVHKALRDDEIEIGKEDVE
jgi:hypothetical protein